MKRLRSYLSLVFCLSFAWSCGPHRPAHIPHAKAPSKEDSPAQNTPLPAQESKEAGESFDSSQHPPLRLCLWNIRKLGHGSKKNYPLLAQIIADNCDALVALEVMQKQKSSPGYELLAEALNSYQTAESWTGLITDTARPNTASSNSEFYAVFYRSDKMRLCEGWTDLRFIDDADGSSTDQGSFRREPAFGCFVMETEGARFDFMLAAFHAIWADGDVNVIGAEVAQLERAAAEILQAVPGENDILLLGDMNLTTQLLHERTSLYDCPLEAETLDPQTRERDGKGTTLRSDGSRTDNIYDHLLFIDPRHSPEVSKRARILDPRALSSSASDFYRELSDHLPLVVELQLLGPDDD